MIPKSQNKSKKTEVVCCARHRKIRASLTLESAFVLPIFVMFCITILFFFRALLCQLMVEEALDYGARIGAATMTEEDRDSVYQGMLLSYLKLKNYKLPETCILGGGKGVVITESDEGEFMELKASYMLKLPIQFFGYKSINVSQLVKQRKWVGYLGEGGGEEADEDYVYVYVAKYGEVYHLSAECTHLSLSVQVVNGMAEVKDFNSSLRACEYCRPGRNEAIYYVTDYGDAYHSKVSCMGLKRTVDRVLIEEAAGKRACSKCGG